MLASSSFWQYSSVNTSTNANTPNLEVALNASKYTWRQRS